MEKADISIPASFQDVTVLVTGGTGFMGKVLTEKLLRSCPELRHIYLLVREKRGKTLHQRLDDIFQDPLFSVVEKEQPKYRHKVSGIAGDMAAKGLSLRPEDREKLRQEVNVVFHGAATVRFDEKLRIAYNINIRGTKEMLALAKEMHDLRAFIHVSTAYANCNLKEIQEKLYKPPTNHRKLGDIIEQVDDDLLLEAMLPRLLGDWPNTYAFTKAIAEDVVREYGKDLPLRIFRPAIVVGTAYEPLIGWTDNVYGPTGLVVGVGCGVIRTLCSDLKCIANIVPVDMTVSALIASAWETIIDNKRKYVKTINSDLIINEECENNKTTDKCKENNKPDESQPNNTSEPPIYNYVSSVEKPLTWGDFKHYIEFHGTSVPTMRAMWYYFLLTHSNWYIHLFCVYLLHYLPALIIDGISKIMGKDGPNLYQIYKKIDKFSNVLTYFSTKTWAFSNNRVQALWLRLSPEDQKVFNFNMKDLDWNQFFYNYIRGLRVYLLKDDLSTLPQAMVRWRRFYWAHQTLKLLFFYIVFRVTWFIISTIYHTLV